MVATRDALSSLLPRLGHRGLDEAAHALDDLSRGLRHDWQRTVVQAFADCVQRNGPEGVAIAQKNLALMLDRKRVDLDFVDLKTASDLLAIMQNAEIDRRREVNAYMRKVGRDVGVVLRAILGGLIGG